MAFRRKILKGKYRKVCSLTKKDFIYKVIMLKLTIRQAAMVLRINYSTAKSIIRLYKTEHLIMKEPLAPVEGGADNLRQKPDRTDARTSSYRGNTCCLKLENTETESSEQGSQSKICSQRELLIKNHQLVVNSTYFCENPGNLYFIETYDRFANQPAQIIPRIINSY